MLNGEWLLAKEKQNPNRKFRRQAEMAGKLGNLVHVSFLSQRVSNE